ncbi:MAG: cytochrome c oxidase subunit II [Elusimicrobia bacterium]|nr:cytochrome c oxidase subunit II [Elusimicrobiota bacterium]
MKRKSAVPVIAATGALISWGLYALFTRFPMMPEAASAQAAYVDSIWNGLLIVEGAIYALIVAFILYCLWAFRANRREEQGARFESSRGHLVEAAWILVSVALTLGLAALGAKELRALIGNPEADIDIEVRAERFSWEFYYPQYKTYGSALVMERGKRHRIILTSKDVVHSFWVPEFRVKQDAVPGKVIPLILTPTKIGQYTLLCNQLCGIDHTDMISIVQVVDHEGFEKSLEGDSF